MSRIFRSAGRSPVHEPLGSRLRAAGLLGLSLLLGACGGVKVRPEAPLPRALLQSLPVQVGLVLDQELRTFKHEETRSGANWEVELGHGHEQLFTSMFSASFANAKTFSNLDAAREAQGLQALFVPRIEQYSFATARETSGAYWAVTIRYRIAVLSPQGEPVDNLTLTGYGSALGAGRSEPSLIAATGVAMRDAAAKFLVQMPRQQLVQKMVAGQVLTAADVRTATVDVVEAVPIEPDPPAG